MASLAWHTPYTIHKTPYPHKYTVFCMHNIQESVKYKFKPRFFFITRRMRHVKKEKKRRYISLSVFFSARKFPYLSVISQTQGISKYLPITIVIDIVVVIWRVCARARVRGSWNQKLWAPNQSEVKKKLERLKRKKKGTKGLSCLVFLTLNSVVLRLLKR